MQKAAFLVLEDGSEYPGVSFGAEPPRPVDLGERARLIGSGEVVFNTGMSGYFEILTDPSYTGQVVTMTYPHIGNYGCDPAWSEVAPEGKRVLSPVKAAGLVVRSLYRGPVPFNRVDLSTYLDQHNIPGISEVDTRRLTLRIREKGSINGCIVTASSAGEALSDEDKAECLRYLAQFPRMEGRDLVGEVGTDQAQSHSKGGPRMGVLDCGCKTNILHEFEKAGCTVIQLPQNISPAEMAAQNLDGLLISNGPGDPATQNRVVALIQDMLGKIPLFGICLGHQLICQALGAETKKMKFGHHGVNHPVRDELTKRVFVTSQNHGFEVDENTLPEEAMVWFRNANDASNEGIYHTSLPVMSTQFHPEAAPGPRDCTWVFRSFMERMQTAEQQRTQQ